jgi:hypothetical protein
MDFLGKPEATSDESTAGVVTDGGRLVYTDVYADLAGGQAPVTGSSIPGAIPGSCGTPVSPASLPNTSDAGSPGGSSAAAATTAVLAGLLPAWAWRRRRVRTAGT